MENKEFFVGSASNRDGGLKPILPKLDLQKLLKLHCDTRFQRAFTSCSCVFKVITLVEANQRNFFESTRECRKCLLKRRVAMQLKFCQMFLTQNIKTVCSCTYPANEDIHCHKVHYPGCICHYNNKMAYHRCWDPIL